MDPFHFMDPSFFIQGDQLDQEYICTICSNVLTKPHSCQQGHTFCHSCISTWLTRKTACPTCRDPLSFQKLGYCRPLETFIQKLQVKCIHHQPHAEGEAISSSSVPPPKKKTKKTDDEPIGCKWTGMLSDRQKHLDDECEFIEVKCTIVGCGEMIQRRDLLTHQNICRNREIPCEHCHQLIPTHDAAAHTSVCDHVSIVCPHGCKKRYMRKDKPEHELTCSHVPIACPMASVGCTSKIARKDMNQHMASDLMTHVELIGKNASLESHFLEWTVPDIRTKLTAGDSDSKDITTGLFKLSLSMDFNNPTDSAKDTTHIGIYIFIKGADGITQKLPEQISIGGSQLTLIHPIDSSKSESRYFDQSDMLTVGMGLGVPNFMKKERCLAEFVWPDGSLHVEATIKFPRSSLRFQV